MNQEYELSLWQDRYAADGTKTEERLCILADNNMTSLIRATNITFTKQINGTKTLNFAIYTHYLDGAIKKENPFWKLIEPERHVKLKWRGEWYDFVVKTVKEDTRNHLVSYTCNDLAMEELSKNGFNLELNKDLQNCTGTIGFLARKVLDGTHWKYSPSSDRPREESEEAVYECYLHGPAITLTTQATSRLPVAEQTQVTIPSHAKILVFYTSTVRVQSQQVEGEPVDSSAQSVQFFYAPEYKTDLNSLTVINGDCFEISGNWKFTTDNGHDYYKCNFNSGANWFVIDVNNTISSQYRASRIVSNYKQVYDKGINRYVYQYSYTPAGSDPIILYGYESIKTNEPIYVKNLINNGDKMENTSGWTGDDGIQIALYPPIEDADSEEEVLLSKGYVLFPTNTVIKNNGLTTNRNYLNDGKGLTKNQKFVLRMIGRDALGTTSNGQPSNNPINSNNLPAIKFYLNGTAVNNLFTKTAGPRYKDVDGERVWEWEFTCAASKSLKTIANQNLTIGFDTTGKYAAWYHTIEFFLKRESENGIINPGEIITEDVVTSNWVYYTATNLGKEEDQKEYYYESDDEWEDAVHSYESDVFEMSRTLEIKESNRFNILQSLAKLFNVWCEFDIRHTADGRILEENGKLVRFKKQFGNETGLCFQYGLDLTELSRTIQSDQIVTKTYVRNNSNEFAPNGVGSIANSNLNYSGSTSIFNFDYYVQHNILNKKIINDLYRPHGTKLNKNIDWYRTENIDTQPLGYNDRLHYLNSKAKEAADRIAKKDQKLTEYRAQLEIEENLVKAADIEANGSETEGGGLKIRIARGCGVKSDDTLIPTLSYNAIRDKLNNEVLKGKNDQQVADYLESDAASSQFSDSDRQVLLRYVTSENVINYRQQLTNVLAKQKQAQQRVDELNTIISNLESTRAAQETWYNNLLKWTRETEENFFKRYSEYIKEGTWIDEKYFDNNEYYLDGLKIAYESSRPKISYSLSAMRLDALEDFQMRRFELGDICFVQDTDFFGWVDAAHTTSYKEKVLISEVTYNILEPSKDTYKLQNYKSQFDDLFQRIVAQTQSLHFAEGSYTAAAKSIAPGEQSFVSDYLQKTLDKNATKITIEKQNSGITWGKEGIIVQDQSKPSLKLRIAPDGIYMTTNGSTWVQVLSQSGLNIGALKGGFIDTNKILVGSGKDNGFLWDENGLNAYSTTVESINRAATQTIIDTGKFVRLDKYGIYGKYGDTKFIPKNENDIWDNASVGMTWQGFFLKNRNGNSSVEISTLNDIRVVDSGVERLKLGRLSDGNGYGFRINDLNGNKVFESDSNGELWLRKTLKIQSLGRPAALESLDGTLQTESGDALGYISDNSVYDIQLGYIPFVDSNAPESKSYYEPWDSVLHRTFDINSQFIVWEDGSVYANNGRFRGHIEAESGTFHGEIEAASGDIGGFLITDTGIRAEGTPSPLEIVSYDDNLNSPYIRLNGDSAWMGADGWQLTNNMAYFRNATLSGKLSTAVFEAQKIQAVGGAMIFKPSYKITHYEQVGNGLKIYFDTKDNLTVGNNGDPNENDIIYILYEVEGIPLDHNYKIATIASVDVTGAEPYILTRSNPWYDAENNPNGIINQELVGIVVLGQEGDSVIGINSNDRRYAMLEGEGLTISTIQFSATLYAISEDDPTETVEVLALISDGSTETETVRVYDRNGAELVEKTPNLFFGNLEGSFNDQQVAMNPGGWGLYCNNVLLEGALVSINSIDNNMRNAGINTGNTQALPAAVQQVLASYDMAGDNSGVVFWGGATGRSLDNATFMVTQNGTLYASQALIDGAVISRSKIQGVELYAAKIYPLVNSNDPKLRVAPLQIFSLETDESDQRQDDYIQNADRGIEFLQEKRSTNPDTGEINPPEIKHSFWINYKGFYTNRAARDTAFIRITGEESKKQVVMNPNTLRTIPSSNNYIQMNGSTYSIRNNANDQDLTMYEETFAGASLKGRFNGHNLFTYSDNLVTLDAKEVKLQNKVTIDGGSGRHGLEYQYTDSGYNLFVY